jgi:microcin C transport system permease protein
MHTFCRNRRSLISLCILGLLFVMAIGAGFIANDKPIIVQFNGKIMIPILREYPETVFGGVFETEALYRDPSVQSLIKADGWMFWPPVRYRHDTISLNQDGSFPSSPNREHPLGTDEVGRDVFARVLYGYRISVFFGICLALVSTVIGVLVGAFLGYRGGLYDIIGQRFIEIWSGMPLTYIMIIVSSIMLPGFFLLLGVMLLFSWMGLVDVVRAEFLRCRNLEYVEAAKVLGVRDRTIILRHILPNALVATATYIPFVINGSIVSLTSLDFLGLGLSSNYPSLGDLLAQGRAYMDAPWIGLSALTVLVLQLTLLVFIGEGIRDALDSYREETR